MEHKKMLASLVGAGLVLGTSWQGIAQETATQVVRPVAFATEPTSGLVVSDGGVEAVREAQESTPAPAGRKFKNAQNVLKEQVKTRKWKEGWDELQKRTIVIESADFKTADPATDPAFFIKRELAAKKAVLSAKVAIIQAINQDMSAMDLVNMPGTDVNKELGAEKERINALLAQQKAVLVAMLEEVDRAEADKLRGTTFGDRLNDMMAAAIKKLDKEYDANSRDKKAQAEYERARNDFESAREKYDEMKKKAEAMQEKVRERQDSAVESMAKMPLYGSSVIMQTESWDESTGKYQVAVMLCWSYAMERAARAIVTGEEFRIKPNKTGKTVQDWLETQNLATMVGPRQYIDKEGERWFLGITARAYDDELGSSERRKNKGISEMYAQQMAAFCLWADVESYKLAQTALESRGNAKIQRDVVAENYAEKLSQSFSNKKIRGMQKLFSNELIHPITGSTIYVAVYGINSNAAKIALEVEKHSYATKFADNYYQTQERGRDAANKAAVKASENRYQDFQKGYNEQDNALNSTVQKRQMPQQPAKDSNIINIDKETPATPMKPKQSTSGTFGGDSNVSDDF